MSLEPQRARRLPGGLALHLGVGRYSVARFLIALVLVIIATPFVGELPQGDLVEAALVAIVLLSAVPAIGAQRRTFWIAIALAVPAVVAKFVNHLVPGILAPWVFLIPGLLCLAFVLLHLVRFILVAPRVDSEVLCAGVAGYLMMALLWAMAYTLVDRVQPGAFTFSAPSDKRLDAFTALYFSFGVLGTVGFGDIVPVARTARLLSTLEATSGMFYVALLISRLVALYSSEVQDPARERNA